MKLQTKTEIIDSIKCNKNKYYRYLNLIIYSGNKKNLYTEIALDIGYNDNSSDICKNEFFDRFCSFCLAFVERWMGKSKFLLFTAF